MAVTDIATLTMRDAHTSGLETTRTGSFQVTEDTLSSVNVIIMARSYTDVFAVWRGLVIVKRSGSGAAELVAGELSLFETSRDAGADSWDATLVVFDSSLLAAEVTGSDGEEVDWWVMGDVRHCKHEDA